MELLLIFFIICLQELNVNRLQEKVERENLARQCAIWNPLNASLFQEFPMLNIDYLKELTISPNQLSPAYIQDQQA